MTTGSRTSGSSVPTAPRHSILTALAGDALYALNDSACDVAPRSAPRTADSGTARASVGPAGDRSGIPRPGARRVERPPYAQLIRETRAIGFEATGRRYGVTGNAIRKWIRAYERESELAGRPERPDQAGGQGSFVDSRVSGQSA